VFHGIEFPPAGECGDPETLAEFARLAEEVGWDGVFLEDYAFYHNDTYRSVPGAPTYDPWVALAAMAARTEGERTEPAPFDLVVGGDERREDWDEERSVISSLAEAGATWWLEWVPAAGFEEMRRAIVRGPLRPS
jgi:hypothetical protein